MLPATQDHLRQLALGEVVADRYRVLGFLGSGGMGEVYEVEHLMLGRHFALKLLRAEFASDPEIAKRFSREARAMAVIESDFVVEIVDFGRTSDERPYFVMQRLRGQDLREHIREHAPLPIAEAVSIVVDACSGLQAVHDAGLVHRDLKPANLFITRRAQGQQRCVLVDFGVVKSLTADSTQQGSFVGTIRYMAPEQILEDGVIGPWTDIYALGAILYECLASQVPIVGDAVERVLFKILNEGPQPLDAIRKDIPTGLQTAVEHALAREPEQRFGCARDFAQAIIPYADQSHAVAVRRTDDDRTQNLGAPEKHQLLRIRGGRLRNRVLIPSLLIAAGPLGWLSARHFIWPEESTGPASSVHPATFLPIIARDTTESSVVASAPAPSVSSLGAPSNEPTPKPASRTTHAKSQKRDTVSEYALPRVDTENPYAK